jgi:GTP-binding protein YchF
MRRARGGAEMKVGIAGLANSGKTTVFNALTGQDAPVAEYSVKGSPTNVGVVKVPDPRVDALAEIFQPGKVTFATVEYIDDAGIVRGDAAQNRKVVEMIKDVDAVLHVVRAFEDPAVVHPLGAPDPLRDASTVEVELIFSDLELVEKRLERMAEGARKGKKADESEKAFLLRCGEALENETPLRGVEFSASDEVVMRHLQFISIKPELMLLNVGEEDLGGDEERGVLKKLEEGYGLPALSVPGKIEMEISQLSREEAQLFLQDLGIEESAMARVIRHCYRHLGLISFLTVGKDEVRAWTVRQGTEALRAAGKIHSDLERGFIRAEVVSYEDFSRAGSMAAAREKGHVRLEGKTYTVQDGDIINFKFNV